MSYLILLRILSIVRVKFRSLNLSRMCFIHVFIFILFYFSSLFLWAQPYCPKPNTLHQAQLLAALSTQAYLLAPTLVYQPCMAIKPA